MSRKKYTLRLDRLVSSDAFSEASAEELRVLLAILASRESDFSEKELTRVAKCSTARCKSALVLWEEEGVISSREIVIEDGVEYEHGTENHFSDMVEDKPLEVAAAISREDLAPLVDQCAEILKKSALSTHETAHVVSLVTQMSLSQEYVLTLLAYLASKGKTGTLRLVKKAEKLVSDGCETVEALEAYIKTKEEESSAEWEFRRIFGIYDRNLSAYEKKLFKKWSEDFGYSTSIVSLAYDKAVRVGSPRSISYIDSVLSAWHDAGCKTVAECEQNSESFKASKKNDAEPTQKKQRKKSDAPTMRYGDFDVEEAFKLALERSYGNEEEK